MARDIKNLSHILTLLFCHCFIFFSSNLSGQCAFGGNQFPAGIFSNPQSGFTQVSQFIYAGEYQLYNVVNGNTYQWSYCTADGANHAGDDLVMTLFNNSTQAVLAFGDDECGALYGAPQITWTATFTGTVRLLTNLYGCTNNSINHTLVWRLVSTGGSQGGCNQGTQNDTPWFTPGCTGAQEEYGFPTSYGEYNYVVLTAGVTYTFGTSSVDDFLTIATNVILAYGSQPIVFTPTASGAYKVYIHANSNCSTVGSPGFPYVQCGSGLTPSSPISASSSTSNICIGQSVDLSVSGSFGVSYWFADNCGSSTSGSIGSGVTLSVSPVTSTTYYVRNFQNGVWSSSCASVTINVSSLSAPPNPTSDSPQCGVGPVTITATGTPPAGVTWYWQGLNLNGTSTALAATSNYLATNSGTYFIRARNSQGCWSSGSGSVSVLLDDLPNEPSVLLSNSPQCNQVQISFTSSPPAGVTWFWQGNNPNGTTTVYGSSNNFYASSSGSYYLRARTDLGCWSTNSVSIDIMVIQNLNVLVSTNSIIGCQNDVMESMNVTFQGNLVNPNYQWYSNYINQSNGGVPLLGETNSNFTPPSSVAQTVYYYCELSFPSTNCTINSNPVTVIVNPAPTILAMPIANQYVCVGGSPELQLIVSEEALFGNGFQWYSNTIPSNQGGTPISGAHSSSYSPSFSVPGTYYFYCKICGGLVTNVSTVVVVETLQFESQNLPYQIACEGQDLIALSVTLSGGLEPQYQWYTSISGSIDSLVSIPGATNSDYLPSSGILDSSYYYCEVTSNGNGCGSPILSSPFLVSVLPQPMITSEVDTMYGCVGYVYDTLSASGNLGSFGSFVWYESNTNGNYDGDVMNTAIPNSSILGSETYYTIYSSWVNGCTADTSGFYIVDVKDTPIIEIYTNDSLLGCAGAIFPMGTIMGVSSGYDYQLQWSIDGDVTGFSNGTFEYDTPEMNGIGEHHISVTMIDEMNNCDFEITKIIPVEIVADPTISEEINFNQTICPYLDEFSDIYFQVDFFSSLENPSYNWFFVEDEIPTLISSSGQNSLLPVFDDEGSYYIYCQVYFQSRGCDVINSSIGKLVIEDNGPYCIPELVIPTLITPGDDGKNDHWRIEGIENFSNYSISIFNILGQEVYSVLSTPPDWDGTWKNEKIIEGDFYFVFNINDINRVVSGVISVVK